MKNDLTHYEQTMLEIGPHRDNMRRFINDEFFKDIQPNIKASLRKVQKSRNLNRSKLEDAFNALLFELFSYVYGKDEFPIRRVYHEMNTDLFVHISEWLAPTNDMLAATNTLHFLNHERGGKRVYEISEGLTTLLYNTELRGLQIEHLNLPFPSIYLMIPAAADIKMYTKGQGENIATGIYISEDPSGVWVDPGINSLIHYEDNVPSIQWSDGLTYEQRTPCRTWNIMIVGEMKLDSDGKINSPLFNAVLRFREGLSLEEVVADIKARYSRLIAPKMVDQWPNIVRLIFNAIIYATNNELDAELSEANPEAAKLWEKARQMPESRKRKNVEDQASRLSRKRTLLGSKIVVDRSKFSNSQGTGVGTPLSVRVLVCGHWRKVAHGVGRTERRLTWIQPFWRGPELGEVSERRHKLTNNAEA